MTWVKISIHRILINPRNKYTVPEFHARCAYFYLCSSVLIICHFNIHLALAGVMHEVGYVYSI